MCNKLRVVSGKRDDRYKLKDMMEFDEAFVSKAIYPKVKAGNKKSKVYRNINNFIDMIYFIAGKLKFDYPVYFT